jgi:hypothetical protein
MSKGHFMADAFYSRTFRRILRNSTLLLLSLAFSSSAAMAQQFREYPQILGKSQSFRSSLLPSWMTVDMDLRTRSEGQSAINYISGNENGYDLTRVRGAVEIRPTHWLSSSLQFQDSHALALPLKYTAANMRDSFDIRQATISVHGESAHLVAGRQELRFGGERLVGVSDWTNTSRTFDALTARIGNTNHVDLFSSSVVAIHPTSFDMHTGGLNFHGAYGTIQTWVPHTLLEPYVFVKALPRVTGRQGTTGVETEVSFGARALGNLPAHFDYAVEGLLQRGVFANDSIHSGAGYVKLGYTAALPWMPRLQAQYDYATGNGNRDTRRVSTFDQLYPSSHDVFGLVDLFGWQNIRQVRTNLDLYPNRNLTILVQHEFLWIASRFDGIYNGSGSLFVKAPTAGFSSDVLGRGLDFSAKYVIHGSFVVNAGVGHFYPGRLMSANSHGAPQTIAYLSGTYRFLVSGR